MKVAIRLQSVGKRNHPLWRIVVAPHKSNMFGNYIQQVGYWCPRHNVNIQREIVMNIPRIKYWIANGGVPTTRVHKFLALWGILPQPWYFKRTQQQRLAKQTPYEELDDKKKRKYDRKMKKKQREQVDPRNYYKRYGKFDFWNKDRTKMYQKIRAQERENEMLRNILAVKDFDKYEKIKQLSSERVNNSQGTSLRQLQEKVQRAKSELALFEKNFANSHPLQKMKLMKVVNQLVEKIKKHQEKQLIYKIPEFSEQEGQFMTEEQLKKKIQYELITKKLRDYQQELKNFSQMCKPITIEQFAQFVKKRADITAQKALQIAQQEFTDRARMGSPILKIQLAFLDSDNQFYIENLYDDLDPDNPQSLVDGSVFPDKDLNAKSLIKSLVTPNTYLPTQRPVNPFPDLQTYIPQDYYQPAQNYNLQLDKHEIPQPDQQLKKYMQATGSKFEYLQVKPKKLKKYPHIDKKRQTIKNYQ